MTSRVWIKGPAWDLCFVALPWLPLALLLGFGLDDDVHERDVLYLVMCVAPLHFLYDGWIWKVGRPEVREPLAGIAAPASA